MATQSIKSDALEPDLTDLRGEGRKRFSDRSLKILTGVRVSFNHVASHNHLLRSVAGYFFHVDERPIDSQQPIRNCTAGAGRDDSDGRREDRSVNWLRRRALRSFNNQSTN